MLCVILIEACSIHLVQLQAVQYVTIRVDSFTMIILGGFTIQVLRKRYNKRQNPPEEYHTIGVFVPIQLHNLPYHST